jgi:hypothetical protein
MEARLQEIEKQSQEKKTINPGGRVKENSNLRDKITKLEEKVISNLVVNNLEPKLHIKHIKEEMNKPIELDHEHNKRALDLIIFGVKE